VSNIPDARRRVVHGAPVRRDGRFVLYWMTSARRTRWNFALEHAIDWCQRLKRPLVVLETLEGGHRWSSARRHRFVLGGMKDNARRLCDAPVLYYPFMATRASQIVGLLRAMARQACLVVCDDAPIHQQDLDPAEVCAGWPTLVEAVDSTGLLPMRLAEVAYPSAYTMRRFLQRRLPDHLLAMPKANPLARARLCPAGALPRAITRRWRPIDEIFQGRDPRLPAGTLIDRSVEAVETPGGSMAAERALARFVRGPLDRYAELRHHPDEDATSGLAPYLHFGHVSAHQVFDAIARHEDWSPDRLSEKADGRREGWWGMSASAEAFLDQLVTWRELGCNFCIHRPDYADYDSLPDWARTTLARHARDRREYVYSLEQFKQAATHDPLWNAAQRQLVRDGRMHNYLRMLWGKKILQWSASPGDALAIITELNNRYALDGCDPNSYSGIFWVLGRYDRPFGPERPVFGKVRYMSSRNTARKVRVEEYLARYGDA